ncbi:hypothetical protein BC830DRAFT_901375 [Chytriomyces sp. MP71]|nr:hypothetical protein BC830DRAFT_901375 [Chytriomyces sp. MP71]
MSSLLPINDTSALFEICWMQSINAGLQWSQLVGCFFIFYCFFFAEKKTLWYVLIAHSITGFIGVLVETLFSALRCAGNTNPQVAYLLAFNEINWIIFEASTVIYSFLKTNTIISNQLVRTTTNVFMFCALCVFAGFRMHIGVLRFNENSLMTPSIAEAHSRAFVVWGLTDVIVFVLMLYATITQLREATETVSVLVAWPQCFVNETNYVLDHFGRKKALSRPLLSRHCLAS